MTTSVIVFWLLAPILLLKIYDLVVDILWLFGRGRDYRDEFYRRRSEKHGAVDVDALERYLERRTPLFYWLARNHPDSHLLSGGAELAYRTPVFLLATVPLYFGSSPKWAGWAQVWIVGSLVILTIFKELRQALVYGELNPFKREWLRHPTRPLTLRPDDVSVHQGTRKAIGYYLLLMAFTWLSFAALYAAMDRLDPAALTGSTSPANLGAWFVQWLYFSASTMATLGWADVHATAVTSRVVVMVEMITGPVFLSLFLVVVVGALTRERV